jgi:hypothetical protein
MSAKIQAIEYYHATVSDRSGEIYQILSQLNASGIRLLAFNAVPVGPQTTQLMLFPDHPRAFIRAAEETGLNLSGPQHAFLTRGDDHLGTLAEVHGKLHDAGIHVYASGGVTADCGRFGYVVYVRAEAFDDAARVLGVTP